MMHLQIPPRIVFSSDVVLQAIMHRSAKVRLSIEYSDSLTSASLIMGFEQRGFVFPVSRTSELRVRQNEGDLRRFFRPGSEGGASIAPPSKDPSPESHGVSHCALLPTLEFLLPAHWTNSEPR